MAFQNNVPIPYRDALLEKDGTLTDPWVDWFTQLQLILDAAAIIVSPVSLTTQGASIGATDFSDGALNAGLYRVSYYARITQAAGVNSSLTVAISWVDGGVTQAVTGAAMVGNTTATHQELTFPIHVDQNSPVTYTTTYASAGVPSMQYMLELALEELNT